MSIFYHVLMVQIYLLTEIYLILAGAVLLADRYAARFIALINLRSFLRRQKKARIWALAAGLLLICGLCFLPMNPGPYVIGDLLPELNLAVLVFLLAGTLGDTWQEQHENAPATRRGEIIGFATLGTAGVHFLFPQLVLL